MDLARELHEHLQAYVDGRLSVAALREWLDLHVQAVEETGDRHADSLFGEAYALLAELDDGHRTEPELRAELRASMALNAAHGTVLRGDAEAARAKLG